MRRELADFGTYLIRFDEQRNDLHGNSAHDRAILAIQLVMPDDTEAEPQCFSASHMGARALAACIADDICTALDDRDSEVLRRRVDYAEQECESLRRTVADLSARLLKSEPKP